MWREYAAGTGTLKRGRKPEGCVAMTGVERQRRRRKTKAGNRVKWLAVLDMETDPFENDRGEIHPFCAELYSDQFGSMVFWNEDYNDLIEQIHQAILSLPDKYTIYAHNG